MYTHIHMHCVLYTKYIYLSYNIHIFAILDEILIHSKGSQNEASGRCLRVLREDCIVILYILHMYNVCKYIEYIYNVYV